MTITINGERTVSAYWINADVRRGELLIGTPMYAKVFQIAADFSDCATIETEDGARHEGYSELVSVANIDGEASIRLRKAE